jgi:hypothetical protein
MIKKFKSFINENNSEKYLLYYSFDWDDNILYMPTKIRMEHREGDKWVPEEVPTSKFAEVRNDKENYRLTDDAFSNFRDTGPGGYRVFLEDMKEAISLNKFGPAWEDFMECLINGSLFSIITARGHESPTMRKGVEWILDNVLSEEELYEMYNNLLKFEYYFNMDSTSERILKGKPSENALVHEYLSHCDFVGVSSPSRGGIPDNPEKAKEEALLEFKRKINNFAIKKGLKAMIGFSDDDLGNVKHIEDLADNLKKEQFPNIAKFIIKGTKNPENITKKVRVFESNNNLYEIIEVILDMYVMDDIEYGVEDMDSFVDEIIRNNKKDFQGININDKSFRDNIKNSISKYIGRESKFESAGNQAPGMESSILKFTDFGNMTNHLNPLDVDSKNDFASTKKKQSKYLSKISKNISKEERRKK